MRFCSPRECVGKIPRDGISLERTKVCNSSSSTAIPSQNMVKSILPQPSKLPYAINMTSRNAQRSAGDKVTKIGFSVRFSSKLCNPIDSFIFEKAEEKTSQVALYFDFVICNRTDRTLMLELLPQCCINLPQVSEIQAATFKLLPEHC